MQNLVKPNGVFSPEELNEMREELDRGNIAGETNLQREDRASEIIERHESRAPAR